MDSSDAIVIRFHTEHFDTSGEPGNPFNPIRGASLLDWLRLRVPRAVQMTAPGAEDWGWYSDVDWSGRHYIVGAMAEPRAAGGDGWSLQVAKTRSATERLFGRARMQPDDPCAAWVRDELRREPAFADIEVE